MPLPKDLRARKVSSGRSLAPLGLLLVAAVLSYFVLHNILLSNTNSLPASSLLYEGIPFEGIPLPEKETSGSISNEPPNKETIPSTCPDVIRKAVGVYADSTNIDSTTRKGFENVLLLVSSNFGYLDFLLNWEYLAKKHGLKYGIVAMDEQLYDHLGPEQSILSNKLMKTGAFKFRDKSFNDISCNKVAVVLDIIDRCDVDVVFSDVDNILLQDPFHHDLGRLIKMRASDYIYLPFSRTLNRRSNDCLTKGEPLGEGNTGFYYLSKSSTLVKESMSSALEVCAKPSNRLDDQTLFWKDMHMKKRENESKQGSQPWYHCSVENGYDSPPKLMAAGQNTFETMEDKRNVKLCCLDAYHYQTGSKEKEPRDLNSTVTFHANFVVGKPGKIKKLKSVSGWNDNYILQEQGKGKDPEPRREPIGKGRGSHIDNGKNKKVPRVVSDYIERVRDSIEGKKDCCNANAPAIDMNIALGCLRQTTPDLMLEYPSDAEAHMNEVRLALATWAQHAGHKMHSAKGYRGPWIENIWINYFEKPYDQSKNTCVWDMFGPFIPIFVPWVDLWVNAPNQFRYPPGLLEALKSVLRPNVPYITVSQNDEGLSGKNELQLEMFPNILVLSAGGYGHVPIPLFKQEEKLNNQKPVKDRSILLSYVGSLNTDRKGIRDGMHSHLIDIDKKTKSNSTASLYEYYKGGKWRSVMADSRFSLAPRGFGRTAYHLVETLQMGLIPIHFYSDVPWVPYADLGIIMVLNQSQIDGAVEELQSMTVKQIEEWEQRIVSLRQSHFSADGTMHQIENFMVGKPNDLRCQPLPPSIK